MAAKNERNCQKGIHLPNKCLYKHSKNETGRHNKSQKEITDPYQHTTEGTLKQNDNLAEVEGHEQKDPKS